jgi:hypothetical protein
MKTNVFFKTASVIFLFLVSVTVNTLGQVQTTGTLSGTVTDPNGGLLSGVQVTIDNEQRGFKRTLVTSEDGRFVFTVLPVGAYNLTFAQKGFSTAKAENIRIEAAVTRNIDQTMQLGEIGETVMVTSENEHISTPETSATFRQLSSEELVRVPTPTRSFTQLLSAEAGVSSDLTPVSTNGTGNVSPNVNGTRSTSTSLFFNGIDATNITSNEGSLTDNISPAPESLEEVKLQTSLYDASNGRSGGGNFQLVTRSGSNEFHGSLYYFVQNEKFNANDFFFNRDGVEKPRARRNEGGFTLGGPILKNKAFFFASYQRTEASTGFVPTASSQTVLPLFLRSAADRSPASLVAAYNATNCAVLRGGQPTGTLPGACAGYSGAAAAPLTIANLTPTSIALFQLINPATGGYFIPAPNANATFAGYDPNATGNGITINGGNPFYRQRNVFPAEFKQDQINLKADVDFSDKNRLSATFFWANFPGFDPFPDPASLASPVIRERADRSRVLALTDTQTITPTLINDIRFGYFSLNNSRRLTDEFAAVTNDQVGIINPAIAYDDSEATRRLGHFVGRPGTLLERFSFGGPNDSYNQRKQVTLSLGDNVTFVKGNHTLRFGGEFKKNTFDTSLQEEQATEFEKFDNITQLLRGVNNESDTQFGITEKSFRFNDVGLYITDDFKVTPELSINAGVRWEFFGLPVEKNGRIGNFDPSLITNINDPRSGFIVASNVRDTGFTAIDQTLAVTARAETKHTLNGQDLNNFAPRIGVAYSPKKFSGRLVVRGGYGMFFDRPSAAFINTVFSNYPFLREAEVTYPAPNIPISTAFSQQFPNFPFSGYLPNRMFRTAGANGTYQLRDGTPTTQGADGTPNPIDPATGLPIRGNIAETFEFRAVDRNLKTPFVHQFNFGVQYEISKNTLIEARYVGTRGRKLLAANSFAQGYDLNDPSTPDAVFQRFVDAYLAAGSPNGALNSGSTARERGVGRAFGFANPTLGGMIDYNLANSSGAVISFEARSPFLGFDVPEAIMLRNSGHSDYDSAQFSLSQRLTHGLAANVSYTFSKSIDTSSSDPGSTSGGGKPDLPNVGFSIQNNNFDPESNRALSDFDRTHRFTASFSYEIPTFGFKSRWTEGFVLSGFLQAQSGTPFSIFSAEVVAGTAAQYGGVRLGSGGLYRLAFGRPSVLGPLVQTGNGVDAPYFDIRLTGGVLVSPLTAAGGYPNNRGFGNLGRNALRGPSQKRFDLGLSKTTRLTENTSFELRVDAFNVFNFVNFANPNGVIGEPGTDFGFITDTVGGPRVLQFAAKFRF